MQSKIMDKLQSFSRAMFIPVLILPIAGLLIAVGNIFTNQRLIDIFPLLDNPVTIGFGSILSAALLPILTNLGLIFCVGLTIGLANKKKAEAGFTAVLAYLIFIFAMNKFLELSGILIDPDNLSGSGQTLTLGVQILDMGVFLGIILGLITSAVHNRFIDTKFNSALQIYGGARFVLIVLIPILILLAVALSFAWPIIQNGINALGRFINKSGNFGLFLYGMLERLLIPTGLHHLVYTPFLYTSLGGVEEIAGVVYEGSRNIYFAEIADPTIKILSQTVNWDARGISKMFGLIGASLAMYQTADPENKSTVKAVLIPAAFTSFIAGVTEPIEFSFMFAAPILYLTHSVLSGLSMVTLNIIGSRAIGPNGFIDFLLYNIPLGIAKTKWPLYILVGVIFFVLYYVIFKILIQKLNLKTIGRNENNNLSVAPNETEVIADIVDNNVLKGDVNIPLLVDALGGEKNIISTANCYTRLRLRVDNPEKVKRETLEQEIGAKGVILKESNVQIVYGLEVPEIREQLDVYLNRNTEE